MLGSGAVGGYYGARLARAGHEVVFVARGAHLKAIREGGLAIRSPLGDLLVTARAEEDTGAIGPVDLVLLAVKTYDLDTALAQLPALVGPATVVLTLQNGVESPTQVAAAVGESAVVGGATYIATSLSAPGLIEQTGTVRRIVFGEVFGDLSAVSPRVANVARLLSAADIQAEPVADGRKPLWVKYIFIAPFAALTGAARLPIGPLREVPGFGELFMAAAGEVERVARAEGVDPGADAVRTAWTYTQGMAPTVRSSMLIDLQQAKRIEVEALVGSVVRRGGAHGVPTPIMSALYAVLKPHESGRRDGV